MIEHWRLADTSTRALAGAGLHVSRWKPEGPRPKGARSERSGDDSAVPARLGRETPTPHRKSFFPGTQAAPTPSPRSRSGASHGEELFAERPAILMAGMARAWSVPPPAFEETGMVRPSCARHPLWANENPDPCGPGFCSSKRVASSDSPPNSGKAAPNVQGC